MAPRPMLPVMLSEKDVARFWTKVRRGDGCWEFTGKRAKGPQPQGHFGIGARLYLASRVAWTIANGPIPDGLWVLHHCDNPTCVRPDHLFLGTRADNALDMYGKGRRQGSNRPTPDHIVRAMLTRVVAGEGIKAVAQSFGLAQSTLSNITCGYTRRALAAEFIPALRPPAPAPRQGVLFPDAMVAA